ncbi:MAG: DUF4278 domain-containing protein [Nodosilinea sp.]
MVFITLLAIAVGIVSALALAIVGLVEAPWQVLLLGLGAALYGLQRQVLAGQPVVFTDEVAADTTSVNTLSSSGSSNSALSDSEQAADTDPGTGAEGDKGCELTYRGIRYRRSQPSSSSPSSEHREGIYRGQRWQR